MTPRRASAVLHLIFCFFLSIGCRETAVLQETAVSQAVPTESITTATAVPTTINTPSPIPTKPASTATAEPTVTPPPNATPIIWQQMAKMPSARSEMSAGVINGRIYVPGGRGNGYDQSTALEMYDPTTDTWTRVPSMHQPCSGFGAAVWDGKIVVAGGELLSPLAIIDPIEIF